MVFNLWEYVSRSGYFIIILGLVFACFWSGALYERFKEPAQSPKDFFMSTKIVDYQEGKLPAEITAHKFYFDKIKGVLWFALLGLLVMTLGDYKQDPSDHYITRLIKELKRAGNK